MESAAEAGRRIPLRSSLFAPRLCVKKKSPVHAPKRNKQSGPGQGVVRWVMGVKSAAESPVRALAHS